MNSTHTYSRVIKQEPGYDIVVAGGGPSGTAAAIAAGRLGARVLLLEGTGALGGMGTSGLVSVWSDLADGERMIVRGLVQELVEALHARGGLKPGIDPQLWESKLHVGFGFNAEVLKLILDELCVAAGVEVRFFTRVVDVERRGLQIDGCVISNVEGLAYVPAKAVVDATGDAFIADLCGVPYRQAGRDTRHIMPPTLCSVQAGVEWERFNRQQQQDSVYRAIQDGAFSQPDRHVPGLFRHGPTAGILNAGHLFGVDAVNTRSLSDGMMWGRRLAEEYVRFYRRYVQGCEHMEFVTTGSLLGVRESRRIVGEFDLTHSDYTARRSFPDQVAIYNKSIDIHVYDCSDEQWERYRAEFLTRGRPGPGEHFGLPYGILVPRASENLWVTGRCVSTDVKVNGSIRDQPGCMALGQAAGTAAVQAIRTGQPACDLNTRTLVESLRAQGAWLPQASLSDGMTRGVSAPPPESALPPAAPGATKEHEWC